uniref:DUF4240 domain-containing protein n=1 Tax=Ascaris lumbricoides TaxID=6252 RepID=A0A0M3HJ73_ASCLU
METISVPLLSRSVEKLFEKRRGDSDAFAAVTRFLHIVKNPVYYMQEARAFVHQILSFIEERTGEQKYYLEWFKAHGFSPLGEDYPDFFEGGGDACFSTYDTLWAGFGPRSNKDVYEHVKKLGKFDVVLCELTHPEFYHLDTCFAPVDEKCALWYPAAFQQAAKDE